MQRSKNASLAAEVLLNGEAFKIGELGVGFAEEADGRINGMATFTLLSNTATEAWPANLASWLRINHQGSRVMLEGNIALAPFEAGSYRKAKVITLLGYDLNLPSEWLSEGEIPPSEVEFVIQTDNVERAIAIEKPFLRLQTHVKKEQTLSAIDRIDWQRVMERPESLEAELLKFFPAFAEAFARMDSDRFDEIEVRRPTDPADVYDDGSANYCESVAYEVFAIGGTANCVELFSNSEANKFNLQYGQEPEYVIEYVGENDCFHCDIDAESETHDIHVYIMPGTNPIAVFSTLDEAREAFLKRWPGSKDLVNAAVDRLKRKFANPVPD